MLSALLSSLLQTFVVDPATAEVEAALRRAKAPVEVIAQVETCVRNGVPALVKQVGDSPAHGFSLALDVWLERLKAEDVIVKAAPSCAPVVAAARPYLRGEEEAPASSRI
ncbi:hypothetical protein [Chenggangzhangella methanolivorans]|uniref:Uncharacterized protein n=1 Tax=Chenggangzhangella methanolivorans TaxID=1437009 RepID=A0A9E6R9D9_9HYPH|nr:hypothetical protein [Chenggangzhangella methanolivorans]QZN99052.1 hypothetical protein K6K41_19625 [Chenggangzhangella methanolivorans]